MPSPDLSPVAFLSPLPPARPFFPSTTLTAPSSRVFHRNPRNPHKSLPVRHERPAPHVIPAVSSDATPPDDSSSEWDPFSDPVFESSHNVNGFESSSSAGSDSSEPFSEIRLNGLPSHLSSSSPNAFPSSSSAHIINPPAEDSFVLHSPAYDDDIPETNEEVFIEGLTYPPQVLEWCNTSGADFVDLSDSSDSHQIAADPSINRLCADANNLSTMRVERNFVDTFRMSSPYINAFKGRTFVIHIPGELIDDDLFASVMEDIALMRVVGIKLVLVLGPQSLVSDRLRQDGVTSQFIKGIRVTDSRALQIVKEISGSMRFEVECALAKGVTNMPSASRITVVSGNFYSAKPVGIIDGLDYGYSGKVRRIDAESIQKRLDDGDIIVLPNVASSPSGQQFNCKSEDVAAECAGYLNAEKLIFLGNGETLFDVRTNRTIPNMSLKTASKFLEERALCLPKDFRFALQSSVDALNRGVRRAHILNRNMDGVLLMEVFHRDGVGLMVSRDLYEGFRQASLKDVNGVKKIIRPLEEKGILKWRSRAMLERDMERFVVIERDGMIIACMSLTVLEADNTWAELGCVAVHRDYRKLGKGDAMLGYTERIAYDRGVRNLFVLSTQSFDWFYERGFREVTVEDLPASRQQMYDKSRRSKIFHKVLLGSRAVDEAEVLKML